MAEADRRPAKGRRCLARAAPIVFLRRGQTFRDLNSLSGLVLFAFAASHLLNHAIGLVGLEAMYEVQQWRWAVTRSVLGTLILAAALATHVAYATAATLRRATLRLPRWELAQLASGVLIPLFLLPHIVETRGAHLLAGTQDSYLYVLARLWPGAAFLQAVFLLLVWGHGCLGLHHWLRRSPRYRAAQPALLFLAVAVPVAALAGFMVSGRAVAALIEAPEAAARVKAATGWPDEAQASTIETYRLGVRLVALAALGLLGAAVALGMGRGLGARIAVDFVGGPQVRAAIGGTLLEIGRAHGVPIASACGGRARCTACRVRIEAGGESLPPPALPERLALAAIGAPEDVRLACQIRPRENLSVTRLVRRSGDVAGPSGGDEAEAAGLQRPLAVLAVDLADLAPVTAGRLAYDVVFILNGFLAGVGAAIEENSGWIARVQGDELIAVFGRRHGADEGCRQALAAARAIDLALEPLNARLEAELGAALGVAMGLDVGDLLVGRFGYGPAPGLAVIGAPLDRARGLKVVARSRGLQLVASADAARRGGWPEGTGARLSAFLAGRTEAGEAIGLRHGRELKAAQAAASATQKARIPV